MSVRSGSTACAPAARRSAAVNGPVATPTARAPAASAADISSGVSPATTVDTPPKSVPGADPPYRAAARRRATATSSVRTSWSSPYAPMHRSSWSRSPSAASFTSATGRMLPVSTDWCTRPLRPEAAPPGPEAAPPRPEATPWRPDDSAASAASAAVAPGSARPRSAIASRTDGARAVRPAMNSSTYRRGSAMSASSSVSRMIARSVRPAIGASASGDRPNSWPNTMVYSSAPTPPAFSSVPSRSHSTRRSDTRHSPPRARMSARNSPQTLCS